MEKQFEQIKHLATLTEEKRIEAQERARQNMIARHGGAPRLEDFEQHNHSRFGATVERITFRFMVVMLLSAFIVSSLHVYFVGKVAFRQGINNEWQSVIVGMALVMLAESAVLVLSLAPAMWSMPLGMKILMYSGAICATLIAAIGNITVSIDYDPTPFNWLAAWLKSFSTSPNKWMIATMPPTLTLIVGQALKYRILAGSEQRQQAINRYEVERAEFQRWLAGIENDPAWRKAWAISIWDTWRYGKRKDVLAGITNHQRGLIILREMMADDLLLLEFQSNPTHSEIRSETHLIDQVESTGTAAERVREVLYQYPYLLDLKRQEAAQTIGVSIGSLQRGIDLYRQNGHHIETT